MANLHTPLGLGKDFPNMFLVIIEPSLWGEDVVLYDGAKMTLNIADSLKCDDVVVLQSTTQSTA